MEISFLADLFMGRSTKEEFGGLDFLKEFRPYLSESISIIYFSTMTPDTHRAKIIETLNAKKPTDKHKAIYGCIVLHLGEFAHTEDIIKFFSKAEHVMKNCTNRERMFMSLIMKKTKDLLHEQPPKNINRDDLSEKTALYSHIFSEGAHIIKHMNDINILPALTSRDS